MKCLCGYEQSPELIESDGYGGTRIIPAVGGEPFIRLTPRPDPGWESIDFEYIQYACPICKTVRIGD